LDVGLAGGRTLRLVLKDFSPRAILGCARGVRPEFLRDPLREITVYRDVLAAADLGTAACYGAAIDEPLGRFWLFLERVPGRALSQVGEFAAWEPAARWLATLHTLPVAGTARRSRAARLIVYDGDYYRLWPDRARSFARHWAARRALERLAARYESVAERLVALPSALLHGEFHAPNVLARAEGAVWRVCPVDWEMAALGPGLVDLAALTAGRWTDERREALALAYYAEWTSRGGRPQAAEEFRTALDCCRLHLALQWLGWSQNWSPPPEHSHNWLGEALRLAERLGL
jgi:aminoglycoside phosphotransferase (APT) family kinase protein